MERMKKIGAGLLCVILILALAASSAFTVHAAGHDCAGEDCPVCHAVAAGFKLLRVLSAAVFILLLIMCVPAAGRVWRYIKSFTGSLSATPVTLKIRLND